MILQGLRLRFSRDVSWRSSRGYVTLPAGATARVVRYEGERLFTRRSDGSRILEPIALAVDGHAHPDHGLFPMSLHAIGDPLPDSWIPLNLPQSVERHPL